MPNERISMSKLQQLIGLQASNLSIRALGRALGLSVGAVSKYLRAVRSCGTLRAGIIRKHPPGERRYYLLARLEVLIEPSRAQLDHINAARQVDPSTVA